MNALELAITRAQVDGDWFETRFSYHGIGGQAGPIPDAYKTAKLALEAIIANAGPRRVYDLAAVRAVKKTLLDAVQREVLRELQRAAEYGLESVVYQLGAYNIFPPQQPNPDDDEIRGALFAIMGTVEAQLDTVLAMAIMRDHPTMVLGPLRPNDVLLGLATWIVATMYNHWDRVARSSKQIQRVAVAVIDQRTTECCLMVNGQIQPLGTPFHLVGSPAYGPYLDAPPFHRYCRTGVAIYNPQYDNGITDKMRENSQVEMLARSRLKTPKTPGLAG